MTTSVDPNFISCTPGIVSTFRHSVVSYYPSLQMSTAASILPLQSIRNSSKWISITEQWLAQINHHKSASLDCHLWESSRDLWDRGGTSPITWLSEAETMERAVWGGCLSWRRDPSEHLNMIKIHHALKSPLQTCCFVSVFAELYLLIILI